jgi:hypothetical protein
MPSRRQRPRYLRRNRRLRHFNNMLADLAAIELEFPATAVDLVNNQLFIPGHSWQTGSKVGQATTTGALPTGLAAATDYYAIRVSDDFLQLAESAEDATDGVEVDLTVVGSGVHTLTYSDTFAAAGVDADEDTVEITGHELQTGDGPFQLVISGGGGDALPTGLAALTDYWVVRVDADLLQFAESYEDATAAEPVVVDITAAGQGTTTVSRAVATTRVDTDADKVVFYAHRLQPGDGPLTLEGADLPAGAAEETDYYAISFSADSLGIAESRAEALAGTAVDLSDAGSGTFTFIASEDAVLEWLKRGRKLRELKALL